MDIYISWYVPRRSLKIESDKNFLILDIFSMNDVVHFEAQVNCFLLKCNQELNNFGKF